MHQRAFGGLSRHDVRRVIGTAFERGGFQIKTQARFLLLLAVAFIAVLFKDGPHLADKVHRRGEGGKSDEKSQETHAVTSRCKRDLRASATFNTFCPKSRPRISCAKQEGLHDMGHAGQPRLGVMEVMVERETLLPLAAADKLEHLLSQGRRLPEDDCRRLLRHWRAIPS